VRRKDGHEHLLSSRTAIFTQTDAVDPGEELYQKVRAAQGWSKSQRVKAPVTEPAAAPPAEMTAAPGAASVVPLDTSLDAAGSDSDSNSEEEESDQEEEEEERDPGVDSFLVNPGLSANKEDVFAGQILTCRWQEGGGGDVDDDVDHVYEVVRVNDIPRGRGKHTFLASPLRPRCVVVQAMYEPDAERNPGLYLLDPVHVEEAGEGQAQTARRLIRGFDVAWGDVLSLTVPILHRWVELKEEEEEGDGGPTIVQVRPKTDAPAPFAGAIEAWQIDYDKLGTVERRGVDHEHLEVAAFEAGRAATGLVRPDRVSAVWHSQ